LARVDAPVCPALRLIKTTEPLSLIDTFGEEELDLPSSVELEPTVLEYQGEMGI
jgi:hypothetical protein